MSTRPRQFKPLEWTLDPSGEPLVVLTGSIDDESDFAGLERDLAAAGWDRVAVDLSGVNRVISMGVRSWFQFLIASKKSRTLVLRRCSTAFSSLLAMTRDLAFGCEVESVTVWLLCGECENETSQLLTLRIGEPPTPRSVDCPACGAEILVKEHSYT